MFGRRQPAPFGDIGVVAKTVVHNFGRSVAAYGRIVVPGIAEPQLGHAVQTMIVGLALIEKGDPIAFRLGDLDHMWGVDRFPHLDQFVVRDGGAADYRSEYLQHSVPLVVWRSGSRSVTPVSIIGSTGGVHAGRFNNLLVRPWPPRNGFDIVRSNFARSDSQGWSGVSHRGKAVRFVVGQDAGFMTGEVLVSNGGWTAFGYQT